MRRRAALLVIAVAAAAVGLGMHALEIGRELELETVDVRFQVRGPISPPDDVVLVQVDEQTLSDLELRWPFPRSRHARVIDRLTAAGARVIAIDLQFTEQTDIDEDNALIEAIDRADGVVLGTTVVDDQGATNVLGGDDVVSDLGARVASALLPLDPDGALRRAAYAPDGLESFGVVAAEVFTRRQVEPFDERRTWIRYAGPPGTLRSYSYSDVLRGRVPPEAFRGRIVVVGTEAARLKDVSSTSTTTDSLMSGPEVQGNAVATVLAGLPLTSPAGPRRHGPDPADGRGRPVGRAAARTGRHDARRGDRGARLRRRGPAALRLRADRAGRAPAGGLGHRPDRRRRRRPPAAGRRDDRRPAGPEPAPAEPQPAPAEPEPADAATVADEIGGCRLEGVIGRGGMGVIFRALQPGLERRVAVKVIAPDHAADPRFRRRFAREARLAAAIDHPNIVPVYATGDDAGRLYLAMRYIEGVNLAQRLRMAHCRSRDGRDRGPGRVGARRRAPAWSSSTATSSPPTS